MSEQDPRRAFDDLMADTDPPMLLVTTAAGDERAGCLVGFATHCSIDPPRFLVCLSKRNRTYRVARRAKALAVHALPQDAGDLAELFGGQTGDDVDKFARCDWRPGPEGVPLVERCGNRFAGAIESRHDVGDHVAFLLSPLEASRRGAITPLRFRHTRRIEPGHEA